MVAAMAGFAVEDMFLKFAARSLPVGQILMIFRSEERRVGKEC